MRHVARGLPHEGDTTLRPRGMPQVAQVERRRRTWSEGGARRGYVAKGHTTARAHVGSRVGATRKVGKRGE